jgi:hypothetical protein
MELSAPKVNLSVHLGQDTGQAMLAKVTVTNHVGDAEVSPYLCRSVHSSSKPKSAERKWDNICCACLSTMSILVERLRLWST